MQIFQLFNYKVIVSIFIIFVGSIYVVSPSPYQIFFLIPFLVAFACYLFLQALFYYARLRKWFILRTNTGESTSKLDPELQKIIDNWKQKLENKYKIVLTKKVKNFQSKWISKKIFVNPDYLRKADPQDIEASFYHEVGHLTKFINFMSDLTLLNSIVVFSYSLSYISILRGEIPFVALFSTYVLTKLIITICSWRSEYRADKYAGTIVSKDAMKKMFDSIPFRFDSDSHPSPKKRWTKIEKMD